MVYGNNTLRCIKCGAVSIGTDYVDLNYMCLECKEKYDNETEQSLKQATEMISGKEVPTPIFIKPLQALLVADPEMMAKIIAGVKKITVRLGFKDYKVDKAVFVLTSENDKATLAVVKNIKKIQWKTLLQLTKEEIEADGYKDLNDALNGLRRFYPEIGLESLITVIEW